MSSFLNRINKVIDNQSFISLYFFVSEGQDFFASRIFLKHEGQKRLVRWAEWHFCPPDFLINFDPHHFCSYGSVSLQDRRDDLLGSRRGYTLDVVSSHLDVPAANNEAIDGVSGFEIEVVESWNHTGPGIGLEPLGLDSATRNTHLIVLLALLRLSVQSRTSVSLAPFELKL